MIYTANWVIIYHLPPIKGTKNNHRLQMFPCLLIYWRACGCPSHKATNVRMHPFIEDLQTLKACSKTFKGTRFIYKRRHHMWGGKIYIPLIPGIKEFIVNREGLDNLSNGEYKSHMFCIFLSWGLPELFVILQNQRRSFIWIHLSV